MNTRRIEEDDLGLIRRIYPVNFVACCLRLVRHDSDLLADDLIHQCRFADVGPADNGDKA
ncbi:hypothetical protein D3C71_2135840 [compost metagenome]